MPADFSVECVPRTYFALGGATQLAAIITEKSITSPLIVTDPGIVSAGLLQAPLSVISNQGLRPTVYDQVKADPPESNVLQAAELAIEQGCDGVIGFGGGSSMDVAKLVAVLAKKEQNLQDIYGVDQITGSRLPLVQVPTTAGTGSEATAVAIITTGKSTKAGVVSRVLFADQIVLDAELTLGLPKEVTAATGIDAMVHAIEAFTSKRLKNPLADAWALHALELLAANIERVVEEPGDLKARSAMLLGSMLAGQAFANAPVGGVHALAYPLGGSFHIPHGLSNSLVLPHVLRFNAQYAREQYHTLAETIFKVAGVDDVVSVESAAEQMADYFSHLAKKIGLPTRLSELDVRQEDLADLADQAMLQQRLLINNPCEISQENALSIYTAAL